MPRGRQQTFSPSSGATADRSAPTAIQMLGVEPEQIRDEMAAFGLEPEWFAVEPSDYDGDEPIYRYHRKSTYNYYVGAETSDGPTEVGDIQIAVRVDTPGRPSDRLTDRLEADLGKVTTAFNTDAYSGYLAGFAPESTGTHTEREEIARNEAGPLGVPRFEVEIYDENERLSGAASGYMDPWTVEQTTYDGDDRGPSNPAPQTVRWRVRKQAARGSYEVKPPKSRAGRASKRAQNATGKQVLINGSELGKSLRSARGTFEIKDEYESASARSQYLSRQELIDEGMNPQEIRDNGALWKVRETESKIYFRTSKPAGFDAIDPDDIDPNATGGEPGGGPPPGTITVYMLEYDAETTIDVRRDERIVRHMGLYTPPVKRQIERETRL